ncbi:MAG: Jag N-terminal domain-containing protein [Proteobacteria bacterium]|nr:Jag N-terminal domain-containing protein [Pseudomonadota bacterium]
MSDFKEFTGKVVDDAIEAACAHYSLSREMLEIEIVSGGSTGIFGLMGKKKAVIRARRREKRQPFADLQPEAVAARQEQKPVEPPAPREEPRARQESGTSREPRQQKDSRPRTEPRREPRHEDRPAPKREQPREQAPRREAAPEPPRAARPMPASGEREPALRSANAPDAQALEDAVREVLTTLLEPLIAQPALVFSHEAGRMKVLIDDEPNSGLIIGREGQTITALQYITNRIVARKFQTSVRVHLDAGDYRDKQDDNLRKLALYLADKAKDQGRTQSTKPLSSYHRRLVHMALQDDDSIATRSKGDGPLKRVLIYPASSRREGRQQRSA